MAILITGCVVFVVTHLGISSTPLRGWLQKKLGARGYLLLYSLISFATLGTMIYGYLQVPHTNFLWYPTPWGHQVTKVMLLIALVMLVMGTLTRNPTRVMNDKALNEEATGLLKITRHPIQWSILLFGVGHVIANGDVASLWFFGSLAVLAFFGMLAMDARRRKEADPRWQRFMTTTSMLPFLALASGKTRMTTADINWSGLLAGLALFGASYWLHDLISGVSLL